MDVEGIYRKSGGKGQVDAIQDGLTRSLDHDISDPDLDINTVASVLKQYFRKLPIPLITFDVYDSIIDAGRKFSLWATIDCPNYTDHRDMSFYFFG